MESVDGSGKAGTFKGHGTIWGTVETVGNPQSTYTANANVVPVILPAMNINAYMRKKYQNGEKQV